MDDFEYSVHEHIQAKLFIEQKCWMKSLNIVHMTNS